MKVALVTGASSGIGESTAEELRKCRLHGVRGGAPGERMAGLAAKGVRVLAMDVTSDESMAEGVGKIIAEAGRIDLLVNNAGYGSYGAVEDVPPDEVRFQCEVNVFGLARLV